MPVRIPRPSRRRTGAALTTAGLVGAALLTGSGAVAGPAAAPAVVPSAAPTGLVADPPSVTADDAPVRLAALGSYSTGVFDEAAAEIVAHHAASQRLFVVNAHAATVEVLDVRDPAAPTKVTELSVVGVTAADGSTVPVGAVANSVAVRADGLVVVAVESVPKTDAGWLVLLDASGPTTAPVAALGAVRVGALPDMVALTDDGARAVVANEGEPSEDYTVDPEGSVSVVDLPAGLAAPAQSAVRSADFHAYEAEGALPDGVRVFAGLATPGPHPVSENLEPEYVTIEGGTAYVTLQEANAVAVVDLDDAAVVDLWALGAKDHGLAANAIDPSDRDAGFAPRTVPGLHGLYLPDAIASYVVGGETYLVTANEGDAREWGEYVEGARVKDLGSDGLAPVCADSPLAALTGDADLGRLNVTTTAGLRDGGACYEELYAFGGRSVSVWTADGTLVADTGTLLEAVTAAAAPGFVNSNHTASGLEGRSDDKGPEPEGLALGVVDGRTLAFVGLERVGGVAVLDVTDPTSAPFVTYLNNRDFSVSVEDAEDTAAALAAAGDLGPEGLAFIAADDSPTGEPVVAVGNEVSGTTTLLGVVGRGFTDVGDDHPFATPIRWLQDRGLADGYEDGSFGGELPVSRQAMAAFLFRWAEPEFAAPATATFPDVPVGHPFFAEVEWMVAAGLADGYDDGTFGATRPVSRQAAAAFLHRLAGEPAPSEPSPFSDVPADHRFAEAIRWMAEADVAEGYADGTFGTTRAVSRQAVAAFLFRVDALDAPA